MVVVNGGEDHSDLSRNINGPERCGEGGNPLPMLGLKVGRDQVSLKSLVSRGLNKQNG